MKTACISDLCEKALPASQIFPISLFFGHLLDGIHWELSHMIESRQSANQSRALPRKKNQRRERPPPVSGPPTAEMKLRKVKGFRSLSTERRARLSLYDGPRPRGFNDRNMMDLRRRGAEPNGGRSRVRAPERWGWGCRNSSG